MNSATRSTAAKHHMSAHCLTRRRQLIGNAGIDNIGKALKALGRYQLRRAGLEQPDGAFSAGPDRIWIPTPAEDAGHIIGRIAQPLPAHALNYRDACLTLPHCEALEGLSGRPGHQLTLAIRAEAADFGVYMFKPGAANLSDFVLFLRTLALECAIPPAAAPIRARARL